jgi:SAM-dependent methyltransferase
MDAALEQVRDDFDRIARLAADDTDHGELLYERLLAALPARVMSALEVGCGAGGFTRRLAQRADRVLGIDLAPEMIRLARERSAACPNVAYEVADVMTRPLPVASFDVIASIATLHHVPMESVLLRLRDALRPGGTLLVLDLYAPVSPGDWLAHLTSYPYAALLRLWGARRTPTREARRLWNEHGRRDRYPALRDVRAVAARHLPGARVRRHLLWRYSLIWRKP